MNMFMKTTRTLVLSIALAASGNLLAGDGIQVKITPDLAKVTVTHDGKKIDIMRNQNQKNR